MEQSIKDLLVQAQTKQQVQHERAEFYTEVQRVIKEQAETIAQLEEKLRNNDGPWPDGAKLTWPVLRKAFLLGAGYGANHQASYVQDEVRDYEEDIYTTVCDNGLYMDISGNMTIDSSDLADHLRFRQINLADLEDIRSFLDMNDEEIMDKLASVGVAVRTLNLDKSTDNATEQTES